jgi:hypothetical protein
MVARRQLTLALTMGIALLGGCAIPFGPGSESPSGQSTRETPRESNQLYLQEQERAARSFDRIWPSDH